MMCTSGRLRRRMRLSRRRVRLPPTRHRPRDVLMRRIIRRRRARSAPSARRRPAKPRREAARPEPRAHDCAALADRGAKDPFDHTVHERVRKRKPMARAVTPPFMGDVQRREGDHRAVERFLIAEVPADRPEMLDEPARGNRRRPPVEVEQRCRTCPADHAAQWGPRFRLAQRPRIPGYEGASFRGENRCPTGSPALASVRMSCAISATRSWSVTVEAAEPAVHRRGGRTTDRPLAQL